MKKISIILLTLILVLSQTCSVFATTADYYDEGWYKTDAGYVNKSGNIIEGALKKGIDVSCYQGDIDWEAVASDDVEFAFIRAGNFKSGLDRCLTQNMQGAIEADIPVGLYVYSYATTPDVARMEAEFALSVAKDYPIAYPIAYDIEDTWHKDMTREELQALVNAFCETIEAAGYFSLVYTSKSWFLDRIGPVDWYTWVAQYNEDCDCSDMSFWQCTSHGRVSGIEGRCDINFQFMDFSEVINKDGWRVYGDNAFFMENYQMHRGWLYIDDITYYCEPEYGIIAKGLCEIDGDTYYFDKHGEMQTGKITIDGKVMKFDKETGALLK